LAKRMGRASQEHDNTESGLPYFHSTGSFNSLSAN
jgi:hypothetical protein